MTSSGACTWIYRSDEEKGCRAIFCYKKVQLSFNWHLKKYSKHVISKTFNSILKQVCVLHIKLFVFLFSQNRTIGPVSRTFQRKQDQFVHQMKCHFTDNVLPWSLSGLRNNYAEKHFWFMHSSWAYKTLYLKYSRCCYCLIFLLVNELCVCWKLRVEHCSGVNFRHPVYFWEKERALFTVYHVIVSQLLSEKQIARWCFLLLGWTGNLFRNGATTVSSVFRYCSWNVDEAGLPINLQFGSVVSWGQQSQRANKV